MLFQKFKQLIKGVDYAWMFKGFLIKLPNFQYSPKVTDYHSNISSVLHLSSITKSKYLNLKQMSANKYENC